jgi:acetate kinase
MYRGLSVDTTMAFSSLEGLPMATRCGELDPGVLIYLIREQGLSVGQVEGLLYRNSGLRGLSGISGDVRELLESEQPSAKLALDYFIYHVGRQLGSLSAVLQGLDAIVFTAGIGENSPTIRKRICTQAAWLGLRLNEAANIAGRLRISTEDSAVAALVIPTDEELVIAKHTIELTKEQREAAGQ